MVEDINNIITNGFRTYKNNLNLTIPMILNIFVTGIVLMTLIFIGIFSIFGNALLSISKYTNPKLLLMNLMPLIQQNLILIFFFIFISILIIGFIQTFFISGLIGMAKQATETQHTSISMMIDSGKKHFFNLFLTQILIGLIVLSGIVFIIPGVMLHKKILIILGVILFVIYAFIISLVLRISQYALVIDSLGPIDAVLSGYKFFMKNKIDVILLYLIIFGFSIGLSIITQIINFIPIINILWAIVSLIISVFILPPLTTVWWVRLYTLRRPFPKGRG